MEGKTRKGNDIERKNAEYQIVVNLEEYFDNVRNYFFYSITSSKYYMQTSFYSLKNVHCVLIIVTQFSLILGG